LPSYLLPFSCRVHLPFWNQYLSSPSTLPAPMRQCLAPYRQGLTSHSLLYRLFQGHDIQLCCLAFDLAPPWCDVNACADSRWHRIVNFQIALTTNVPSLALVPLLLTGMGVCLHLLSDSMIGRPHIECNTLVCM
jgi:hypothetical protein